MDRTTRRTAIVNELGRVRAMALCTTRAATQVGFGHRGRGRAKWSVGPRLGL